jgi:hypothetical protein
LKDINKINAIAKANRGFEPFMTSPAQGDIMVFTGEVWVNLAIPEYADDAAAAADSYVGNNQV